MAFDVELAENRYGKSRVRLMKVVRTGAVHDLYEWNVQILLQGDFESAHVDGDNSKILATDTMKNTVYSRAKESKATAMEEYAKELIEWIHSRNPQVSHAQVTIEQALWKRMTVNGKPHDHSFIHGSNEVQTTVVERAKTGPWKHRLRSEWLAHSEDHEVRVRGLHPRIADDAARDQGPHLRNGGEGGVDVHEGYARFQRDAHEDPRGDAGLLCPA